MTDADLLRAALHQIAKTGKTQMGRDDVHAIRRALGLHAETTFSGIALALSAKTIGPAIFYRGSDFGRKGDGAREPHYHFGITNDSAVGNGQSRTAEDAE